MDALPKFAAILHFPRETWQGGYLCVLLISFIAKDFHLLSVCEKFGQSMVHPACNPVQRPFPDFHLLSYYNLPTFVALTTVAMAKFPLSFTFDVLVGSATLCAFTGVYLLRRYAMGGVCKSRAMLTGKTVVITGANAGIGKETAVDLARRNARVIMACRSAERGEMAAVEVRRRSNNDNVVFHQLDLASLASIHEFATQILKQEKQLDILINNAGVFMLPLWRTKDGFEMHFGVNYLGHFLLTNLLLERLKEAPAARIVNVAADIPSWLGGINFDDINSEKSYSRVKAVIQSKLAIILSSQHLAQQLAGTKVTVNTVHPGIVRNDFGRYLDYWYGYFQVSAVLVITTCGGVVDGFGTTI